MRLSSFPFLPGAALVILSTLFFTGCQTVNETGRSQLNLVSADEEVKLGVTAFQETKQKTPISKDAQTNEMLQRVGKRIAGVANLANAQWEFVVFESPEANAWCLPGGKVGVYTGILPITKNEAGLATVIGHEVAHATAHHGAERMSQQMVAQFGSSAAGALVSGKSQATQAFVGQAYGVVSQVGVLLPFSRKQEAEADYIGLLYMARAGYEPAEAVAFWQRFSDFNRQHGGSEGLSFLRTHPLDEQRIRNLKNELPKAQAEYEKAKAAGK